MSDARESLDPIVVATSEFAVPSVQTAPSSSPFGALPYAGLLPSPYPIRVEECVLSVLESLRAREAVAMMGPPARFVSVSGLHVDADDWRDHAARAHRVDGVGPGSSLSATCRPFLFTQFPLAAFFAHLSPLHLPTSGATELVGSIVTNNSKFTAVSALISPSPSLLSGAVPCAGRLGPNPSGMVECGRSELTLLCACEAVVAIGLRALFVLGVAELCGLVAVVAAVLAAASALALPSPSLLFGALPCAGLLPSPNPSGMVECVVSVLELWCAGAVAVVAVRMAWHVRAGPLRAAVAAVPVFSVSPVLSSPSPFLPFGAVPCAGLLSPNPLGVVECVVAVLESLWARVAVARLSALAQFVCGGGDDCWEFARRDRARNLFLHAHTVGGNLPASIPAP